MSIAAATESRPDGALEAELVVLARKGSAEAYEALYRAHVKAIVGLARARGSRDEHTVADIVQEVFTRALEHLDQLRDPQRFGAWLLAITDHVIVDHHRSAQRSPVAEASSTEARAEDDPPELLAEVDELARLLRRAVAGLAARDAMAITLVSSLGLSSAELGRALGVSPGAAKVVLHRARRRLRGALKVQVLLERRLSDCPELLHLVDGGATIEAARHAEHCPGCSATEIVLFDDILSADVVVVEA